MTEGNLTGSWADKSIRTWMTNFRNYEEDSFSELPPQNSISACGGAANAADEKSEKSFPIAEALTMMEQLDGCTYPGYSKDYERNHEKNCGEDDTELICDDISIPFDASNISFPPGAQRRPRSTHGLGGRTRGIRDEVRRTYNSRSVSVLCYHLLTVTGGHDAMATCFLDCLRSLPIEEVPADHPSRRDENYQLKTEKELKQLFENRSRLPRSGLEIVYVPWFAICARFATTATSLIQGLDAKSRARHTCVTWIDKTGFVRCSCIGSTDYRIKVLSRGFQSACCSHAESVMSFLQILADICLTTAPNCGMIVGKLIQNCITMDESTFLGGLPAFAYAHSETIAILAMLDKLNSDIQLVPVRCVKRAGRHFICAFCDLSNQCEHGTIMHSLQLHGGPIFAPHIPVGRESIKSSGPLPTEWDPMAGINAVSNLPLCLVNCKESIRADRKIVQLSQGKQIFYVTAPKQCQSCGFQRNNSSRKVQKGLVLCSEGPCAMRVEIFDCSNVSCKSLIHAEGREQRILLLSFSTAATHVMLRRELTGVALGNGTLRGRLAQYHSQMLANVDSDLVPGTTLRTLPHAEAQVETLRQLKYNLDCGLHAVPLQPCLLEGEDEQDNGTIPDGDTGLIGVERKWRSVRLLERLCVAMCKLMIIDPPPDLYRCCNCEGTDGRLHAICCDGVWVGYRKTSRKMFANVSLPCQAMAPSKAATNFGSKRPLITLLRRDQTVTFLLQGIRGVTSTVSGATLSALISAVRLVNGDVLPADYFAESICGLTPKHFLHDIGDCILQRLRNLLKSLFNEVILCNRLSLALFRYLGRAGSASRKRDLKGSLKNDIHDRVMVILAQRLDNVENTEGQGICWKLSRGNGSVETKYDSLDEVFLLFKALLQGPSTQLITRNQLPSLFILSTVCQRGQNEVLRALSYSKTASASRNENVLSFFRLLRGGLLSAMELESFNPGLLAALGKTIGDTAIRVRDFYAFYSVQRSCSASSYAQSWGGSDREKLREDFLSIPAAKALEAGGTNLYARACRSGIFFPGYEQVRPLPFNDELEQVQPGHSDVFGYCSKTYLQKNKSFTPGALTFCCSCPTPIILGMKVLEKNEGPRAVLDAIVSRFAKLPRHLIYDFGCGLYTCAVHTLWWAMEDTTVVSDSFHAVNHTCSPSFIPSAHDTLNMTNTVSHEQRNRGISEISKSLRATSQEFYISLLAFHISILNIKAKAKGSANFENRGMDVSQTDLEYAFFHCLRKTCQCCQ